MATEIRPCNCKHEWQDKKYGKGRRVKNTTLSSYRCTVCGTVESGNQKK